jgi:hypothetical protein
LERFLLIFPSFANKSKNNYFLARKLLLFVHAQRRKEKPLLKTEEKKTFFVLFLRFTPPRLKTVASLQKFMTKSKNRQNQKKILKIAFVIYFP